MLLARHFMGVIRNIAVVNETELSSSESQNYSFVCE